MITCFHCSNRPYPKRFLRTIVWFLCWEKHCPKRLLRTMVRFFVKTNMVRNDFSGQLYLFCAKETLTKTVASDNCFSVLQQALSKTIPPDNSQFAVLKHTWSKQFLRTIVSFLCPKILQNGSCGQLFLFCVETIIFRKGFSIQLSSFCLRTSIV